VTEKILALVANKLAIKDVNEYIDLIEFINTNNATYKCIDILDTLGKELEAYIEYFNSLSIDELVKKQIETVIRTTLLQLYKTAVYTPYSFLYCKLNAKHKNDMFLQK
jgi:(p)ppGpp synthase/HD superfamily hydrolase